MNRQKLIDDTFYVSEINKDGKVFEKGKCVFKAKL